MLKITGIVIGLLLGFLLCTVLALFLVPVRYRVGAVKQGERLQLNIGLSWMLRMVSIAVSGRQKEKPVVLIRLFGFRLPVFGGKKPEKARKKKNKQKDSGRRDQTYSEPDGYEDAGLSDESPDLLDAEMTDDTSGEEAKKAALSKKQRLPEEPEKISLEERQRSQEEKQNFSEKKSDSSPEPESTGRTGQSGGARFRGIRRSSAAVRRILGRLTALKKKLKALWKKFLAMGKKPAQMKKAFEELCEKFSGFFQTIEEYEIKEICGSLYGEALYLLRHYKPRRIRGYLRFGAGDPALTGYLTGLIYLLLPARADQFSVMPDFHETTFETEAIFTGYIRSVHLVRTVLHLFFDKKVRRVFHRDKA